MKIAAPHSAGTSVLYCAVNLHGFGLPTFPCLFRKPFQNPFPCFPAERGVAVGREVDAVRRVCGDNIFRVQDGRSAAFAHACESVPES